MPVTFVKKINYKNLSDGTFVGMPTDQSLDADNFIRIENGIGDVVDAYNAHEALTTTAHGGIVSPTDPALTNQRVPTDGSVTAVKIATAAVTTAKIADGAVLAIKIPDGEITSAKIADGTIVGADIAASVKDPAAGTPGLRTLGVGSTQALPGDHVSTTNQRVPTDASVTDAKLAAAGNGFVKTVAGVLSKVALIGLTDIPDGLLTLAKLAAALKPSGTAADSDEALRALGYTSKLAAPGDKIGAGVEGGQATAADRFTTLEAAVAGIPSGAPGKPGITEWEWSSQGAGPGGNNALEVGDIYLPWAARVPMKVLSASAEILTPGSGRTRIDVEKCDLLNPPGGTAFQVWQSIWDTDPAKIEVVGGQMLGFNVSPPARDIVPTGGGLRIKVIEASIDGGSVTLDANPVSAKSNSSSSFLLPTVAAVDLANGDVVMIVALANQPAPSSEPSQLSNISGPLTPWVLINSSGSHQMWAFAYRHTWNSITSDPATWLLPFATATPIVAIAWGVRAGTFNFAESHTKVQDSGGTSVATPGAGDGMPSVPNGALMAHLAFTRTVSGVTTPSIGTPRLWDVSLPTDKFDETTRTTAQNLGISLTHEDKSGTGIPTARNWSFFNSAYRMSGTLVFDNGGTAPKDGLIVVDLERQA